MARGLIAWVVIILAEFAHALARTIFLAPYVGDLRARQIGVVIGSVMILGIAVLFIRWIGVSTRKQLLTIGSLWLTLTLAFEFGFGRFVMGYPWERLLSDYNPVEGGWLAIGMAVLFVSPLLAAKIRRMHLE